jgi:hypothetical protein
MVKEEIKVMITLVSSQVTDPLHDLLRSSFGENVVFAEPGVQVLRLAPGVFLQLVGPAYQAPAYLTCNQPLISYCACNLQEASDKLLTWGATILYQATDTCTGFSFSHIQLPDGRLVGFMQC